MQSSVIATSSLLLQRITENVAYNLCGVFNCLPYQPIKNRVVASKLLNITKLMLLPGCD